MNATRFLRRLALALGVCLAAVSASAQEGDGGSAAAPAATARALVEVLQDETARTALIEELEKIGAEGEGGAADAAAAAPAEPERLSLGRRIADTTQGTAESIAGAASELWTMLAAAPATFAGLGGLGGGSVLVEALVELALVVAATYAVFLTLRMFAKGLYRGMGERAEDAGPGRMIVLALASLVIDATVVALAWAAGYAITLLAFGEMGHIGLRQTLYLNAFLIVEMARVVLRFVLSPTTAELRFIDVSDRAARTLTRALSAIVMIIGYGQLLLVPIVNQDVSRLAGSALSSLAAAVAVLIAVALVIRYATAVGDWLVGSGERQIRFRFLRWLARHWHWAALVYLAWLFVIVVGRPGDVLLPVLAASGKIVVAILAGMVVTNALGRATARGISLPEAVTTRLPLLERRLNTFVPKALLIMRLAVLAAVLAVALDVVGLWDIRAWMESQVGVETTATIVSALFILLAGFVAWLAMSSWVDWRLNPDYGSVPTAREETLLTLFRNAATIAIAVVTLMFFLSEIGINIAPLLASAGVLGLAIGFGAQKMVQDIITGVFIQFENAINVGDVITVGGTTGTVERLTIRSVALRDLYGTYHIIPFSSVDMVSNFNRGFAYFVMDMGIGYGEDVDEAREALFDAFGELKSDAEQAEKIFGDLEWFGLQSFGDSAVVVRCRIKTRPGQQWGVGRAFNGIVKKVFDARGIEIPFPHRTIYWGEAKDGQTPPLRIVSGAEPKDDPGPKREREAGDISSGIPADAEEAGQGRE